MQLHARSTDDRGRVHPVSYYLPRKDKDRQLRVHERRDVGACLELLPALLEQGFTYGEPVLNRPPGSNGAAPAGPLHAVDLSFARPTDLLLQTTRPPIHDMERGNRKQVERAWTDLELRLFDSWLCYLDHCSRLEVRLAPKVRGKFERGFESRREMTFLERACAPYKGLNALEGRGLERPPNVPHTALFLLRLREVWPGGPGLLGAFGMDGISTLIWAYRLGRDFRALLHEEGFCVAELEVGEVPERPTDLRWCAEWPLRVVLRHAL